MRYKNGLLADAVNEGFTNVGPGLMAQNDQFPSMTLTTFVTMTGVTIEGQIVTSYIG
ncbi:hypothetical protein ACLMAJ_31050 [Nocardia sp. KC 131]|uniref:hypothetical protein n=1 Tax=Nocardia arseniciresistens TaxID=3392119 RepID=UPI00398F1861